MAGGPATDDAASFAVFVEGHRAELVRAAGRIAVDSAEAEAVVQDTLVALWRHWQRRRPDDPAAYAFRAVTLNAIKRRMRRRRSFWDWGTS
jgi:DNA-directed RNA polymerase specialized sigma24 family protein